MSARMEASRKLSPPARAISRTISRVASRCGPAPAVPALPSSSGTSNSRAAPSTISKSRRVTAGVLAILPAPR